MRDRSVSSESVPGAEWIREEPWEAEVASLLAGLAPVEPPDGFLARAVDHRPRFAGRTLVGLGVGSIVLSAVIVAGGGLSRPLTGLPPGDDAGAVTQPVDQPAVFGQAAVGADELSDPLRALRSRDIVDRVRDAAAMVMSELGFPSLD